MQALRSLAAAGALALALTGCATPPVAQLSDHDLCLQRAVDASTQAGGRWTGPAQAEAAKRGLDCDTPALHAEAIRLQTGGMRVVNAHWLPPQGALWAVQDCRNRSSKLQGYDWIETYTLQDDTERTCLQGYGVGY